MQIQTLTKISIILNIIFICGTIFLTILSIKKNYFQKLFNLAKTIKYNYINNARYTGYTALYPLYIEQKDIVMFGNSLTNHANWNELLRRSNIANRGIGGDIAEGLLGRLNYIVNIRPEIVFIEGGQRHTSWYPTQYYNAKSNKYSRHFTGLQYQTSLDNSHPISRTL